MYAVTKLYEMVSSPGYTVIHNAVYAVSGENAKDAGRVILIPALMQGGAGLNVAYAF
jgi:hypothetical protein